MDTSNIRATFGPVAGDRTALSTSSQTALDRLYQHPIAHNLEWSDVIALFDKIGTVDHRANNEIVFAASGSHFTIRKPHAKDLTAPEVMAFRHVLSQAGWSPSMARSHVADATVHAPDLPNLLVVVEYDDARLYQLDIRSGDQQTHTIRPHDPHHFQHRSPNNQASERGQRSAEDPSYYVQIADALLTGGQIIVIGHGDGHSNAAHHLLEFLSKHRPETFGKVVGILTADVPRLTTPQLLDLGRRALSAPGQPTQAK